MAAGLALLLSFALPACGGNDGDKADPVDTVEEDLRSTESSPFEVVDPPAGFELAEARLGTTEPVAFDEYRPSQEGYTVLSEDGTLDGEEVIAISYPIANVENVATPRPGFGFMGNRDEEPYAAGTGWSDLLAVDDELGVGIRISSTVERSDVDLAAIADDAPAPPAWPDVGYPDLDVEIDRPVGGYEVVGRVDPTVLVALEAPPERPSGEPTDPAGSHAQRWVAADGSVVSVRTLPGQAADLEVLGEHPWLSPRLTAETSVGGRPARHLEYCWDDGDLVSHGGPGDPAPVCSTALASTSTYGDLVVVSTATGVDRAVLERFAAGVQVASAARWDDVQREAWGWPEPRPDPGRTELARGRTGDVSWLLQSAGPDDQPAWGMVTGIDACIKLSTLVRACPSGMSQSGWAAGDFTMQGSDETLEGMGFVAVAGIPGAAAVRAVGPAVEEEDRGTRPAFDVTVDLVSDASGAGGIAVLPERIGFASCPDDDAIGRLAQLSLTTSCVLVLDAAGEVLRPIGFGTRPEGE